MNEEVTKRELRNELGNYVRKQELEDTVRALPYLRESTIREIVNNSIARDLGNYVNGSNKTAAIISFFTSVVIPAVVGFIAGRSSDWDFDFMGLFDFLG